MSGIEASHSPLVIASQERHYEMSLTLWNLWDSLVWCQNSKKKLYIPATVQHFFILLIPLEDANICNDTFLAECAKTAEQHSLCFLPFKVQTFFKERCPAACKPKIKQPTFIPKVYFKEVFATEVFPPKEIPAIFIYLSFSCPVILLLREFSKWLDFSCARNDAFYTYLNWSRVSPPL